MSLWGPLSTFYVCLKTFWKEKDECEPPVFGKGEGIITLIPWYPQQPQTFSVQPQSAKCLISLIPKSDFGTADLTHKIWVTWQVCSSKFVRAIYIGFHSNTYLNGYLLHYMATVESHGNFCHIDMQNPHYIYCRLLFKQYWSFQIVCVAFIILL